MKLPWRALLCWPLCVGASAAKGSALATEWSTIRDTSKMDTADDRNGDGRPDAWTLTNRAVAWSVADQNFDGQPDEFRCTRSGREAAKQDRNFDGAIDSYTVGRPKHPERATLDVNFDGSFDTWLYYQQDELLFMINGDAATRQITGWTMYDPASRQPFLLAALAPTHNPSTIRTVKIEGRGEIDLLAGTDKPAAIQEEARQKQLIEFIKAEQPFARHPNEDFNACAR